MHVSPIGEKWSVLGPRRDAPAGRQANAYVSADERFIVIVSDGRPGGLGGDDLWVSERGADGRWLYFTSHRRGTADLYRVPLSSLGLGR